MVWVRGSGVKGASSKISDSGVQGLNILKLETQKDLFILGGILEL